MHVVVASEGFTAVRALAGARRKTLFDAIFAEYMATCFDRSVFEIATTHRAQCKCLNEVSFGSLTDMGIQHTRNISYSEEELPRLLFFQLSRLFLVSESDCFKPATSVSACRKAEVVLPSVESLDTERPLSSATWCFRPSMRMLLSVSCC